ncbi:hypothetical protein [Propionibacterium freudenreichii]|uniref:hypothetical protein n=1 Tax=Propionibacterium freudenreichii TaxID=1744 RepID=UPI000BC34CC5|nr:hypothetical protein [Propionibacterium freudenreichii]MDK9301702.1 hypothetical protein [Propionibacterium freudenreichii]MDK9321133.1 hypothetical protein [Propionibacterium freudenreichii]MDK9323546.1 hypothetical protein [Propionibacterium freudenreichii]MDK9339780.1 hypothetical protein [Propionibacterium freudenreichii]MDK9648512.1 hypothetical protein [Propionibacterium freudenreichii]
MKHHTSSTATRTTPYEIEGRAFLPGEIIGVAILLRNTEANRYGEAQVLIKTAELPGSSEGVVLFGYDSGTLHYEDPR